MVSGCSDCAVTGHLAQAAVNFLDGSSLDKVPEILPQLPVQVQAPFEGAHSEKLLLCNIHRRQATRSRFVHLDQLEPQSLVLLDGWYMLVHVGTHLVRLM